MSQWNANEFRDRFRGQASRYMRMSSGQSSWPLKIAAGAAGLVLLAIVLLLVIPATLVFLLVLLAGRAVQAVGSGVRGVFGGGTTEGRRNVRVIVRRDASEP
ncbi:MAG: hypothetical protein VYC34_03670 [Planctomycetota bacterium]|nr:hypothetical protein [Planctomycetota bacterium]